MGTPLNPNEETEELFYRLTLAEKICDKLRGHKHTQHDPKNSHHHAGKYNQKENKPKTNTKKKRSDYSRVDKQGGGYNPSLAQIVGEKIREQKVRRKEARIERLKEEWLRRHRGKREVWEGAWEWFVGQ